MVLRPIYLALFSLTLLAVIAGSSALLVLTGKGRDLLLFSTGIGVGMSLVSALSLELWHLSRQHLATMQQTVLEAVAAMHLGQINPRLLLNSYRTPQQASDIYLELECRRLLDRMHQLLAKAVTDDGFCSCCNHWGTHSTECPIPAAQLLYARGKRKRLPWREYRKTLPREMTRIAVSKEKGDF